MYNKKKVLLHWLNVIRVGVFFFYNIFMYSIWTRKNAVTATELHKLPNKVFEIWVYVWHWWQHVTDHVLCLCLWFQASTLDTDFVFSVSKIESPTVLHHILIVRIVSSTCTVVWNKQLGHGHSKVKFLKEKKIKT